jgi:putative PIN family toxin of toxin-antitoxin system
MISACIDANIFISYLLAPGADRAPNQVVHAGFSRRFNMSLSETTLQEVAGSVQSTPWLAARIDQNDAATFLFELRRIATIAREATERFPAVTRDAGDDYLIAHTLISHVNLIVSGDEDLLVLGEVAGVHIVTPAAFMAILDAEDSSGSTTRGA